MLENGTVHSSYKNFCELANIHGLPMGAIHRIKDSVHSTMVFFNDGYVFNFQGFKVGSASIETALLHDMIVKIIGCSTFPLDIFAMIGSEKDAKLKKAIDNDKAIHYIVSPQMICDDEIFDYSIGYKMFEEYREEIYTKDLGMIFELELENA